MIRRFLAGGVAIVTALLFSTLATGTANATADVVAVQQLNAFLLPVCAQNYVVLTQAQTIHDPTCAGAVYASIASTGTLHPITVRNGNATYTFNGLYIIPIGANGIDIDIPAGLL